MDIALFSDDLSAINVDLLAIPVFEEALQESWAFAALDAALEGELSRVAEEEGFLGKAEQTLLLHPGKAVAARRVLAVGLGKRGDFGPHRLRQLSHALATTARSSSARTLGVAAPTLDRWHHDRALQAIAEGIHLGAYRFDTHKSEAKAFPGEELRVVLAPRDRSGVSADMARTALERGELIAGCVNNARDLVNGPAADVTPSRLAEFARELAKQSSLKLKVLDRKDCEKAGMGLYLGVAKGSQEEPRFIHLTYTPKGRPTRTVAMVGKGVTFDSGGLSIKTSKGMEDMKTDMAGGAAVLAAMEAIAKLQPSVRVHAICAATENMPSGTAYRPGDVLKGMSGRTVEVLNTDAEGRLTLGDALTYAVQQEVDEIIEYSTLTGSCVVALGPYTAGLMSMDDELAERFLCAARDADEDFWRLPLVERLAKELDSEIADCKNIGGSYGGAISAGLFLREFVGDTPYAHCDIAGPAFGSKAWGIHGAGATGVGVLTLVEYITRTLAS